jgi:hypothetical protein
MASRSAAASIECAEGTKNGVFGNYDLLGIGGSPEVSENPTLEELCFNLA